MASTSYAIRSESINYRLATVEVLGGKNIYILYLLKKNLEYLTVKENVYMDIFLKKCKKIFFAGNYLFYNYNYTNISSRFMH